MTSSPQHYFEALSEYQRQICWAVGTGSECWVDRDSMTFRVIDRHSRLIASVPWPTGRPDDCLITLDAVLTIVRAMGPTP